MKNMIIVVGALALLANGCGNWGEAKTDTATGATADPPPVPLNPEAAPVASTEKKLFLDMHELGRGKVTLKDAAQAHEKDLATEGKYGVDYKAYWVDEQEGKIYCLAEAPSAEAANAVHKEAHGLVASRIVEVTQDNTTWRPTAGTKLYLDVHHLGAGKVTAKDVAEAHQKDLAVQAEHNVKYLNYWLDAASGTVMCLAEAPDAEAAIAVHREAHGLIPDSIEEVSEGR